MLNIKARKIKMENKVKVSEKLSFWHMSHEKYILKNLEFKQLPDVYIKYYMYI